ncbi:Alpha/Beta hydrolase protein [Aspergillus heterothallicus]
MRGLLSILPSLVVPAAALAVTSEVTVKNGTLIGAYSSEYNQDFVLGIPYAQPPVGNLRYRHPQALNESWTAKLAGFPHEENEDCLTLNVVRPSGLNKFNKLPVLVWIHGGGLQEGGSADQRYNMTFLVQESVQIGTPVIGVSFNYRLSGFGFLPGRAINESGIANLGLYDQRKALSWIQERAFLWSYNT